MFCSKSNALGEPGKGIHSTRFLGLAAADLGMTVVAALVISVVMKKKFDLYHFLIVFCCLMVAGVIAHLLFCVKTPITNLIVKKEVYVTPQPEIQWNYVRDHKLWRSHDDYRHDVRRDSNRRWSDRWNDHGWNNDRRRRR